MRSLLADRLSFANMSPGLDINVQAQQLKGAEAPSRPGGSSWGVLLAGY